MGFLGGSETTCGSEHFYEEKSVFFRMDMAEIRHRSKIEYVFVWLTEKLSCTITCWTFRVLLASEFQSDLAQGSASVYANSGQGPHNLRQFQTGKVKFAARFTLIRAGVSRSFSVGQYLLVPN